PLRLAVCQKLLEHRETNLTVIQCVAEVTAFVNPSCRNPRQRQTDKLLDLVLPSARTGISEDYHVGLIDNAELVQHRAPVLSIIPNRDETKFHLRIFGDDFVPAASFELRLAIRAPRRPQMNNSEFWCFDRVLNFLLYRRLRLHRASDKREQDQ